VARFPVGSRVFTLPVALVSSGYVEFRMMDKVHRRSDSECEGLVGIAGCLVEVPTGALTEYKCKYFYHFIVSELSFE
jgi:hypothetical protein